MIRRDGGRWAKKATPPCASGSLIRTWRRECWRFIARRSANENRRHSNERRRFNSSHYSLLASRFPSSITIDPGDQRPHSRHQIRAIGFPAEDARHAGALAGGAGLQYFPAAGDEPRLLEIVPKRR